MDGLRGYVRLNTFYLFPCHIIDEYQTVTSHNVKWNRWSCKTCWGGSLFVLFPQEFYKYSFQHPLQVHGLSMRSSHENDEVSKLSKEIHNLSHISMATEVNEVPHANSKGTGWVNSKGTGWYSLFELLISLTPPIIPTPFVIPHAHCYPYTPPIPQLFLPHLRHCKRRFRPLRANVMIWRPKTPGFWLWGGGGSYDIIIFELSWDI